MHRNCHLLWLLLLLLLLLLWLWLTTRQAAWCIILVVSVCLYVMYVCLDVCYTITFESLDVRSSYSHMRHISTHSPRQGQGNSLTGSKKVENSYSCNVKLRSAIIPVLSNIQPRYLRAAWGFWVQRIEWCNRHLFM